MVRRRRKKLAVWAVPALYALSGVATGMILPRLEYAFATVTPQWIGPGAALAILSAVSSGMIALTGIVFSLAFVMVQFSATAYSPRLVLWVARDPVIWHATGTFTATFLYSLAAMAWVERGGGSVLPISTWFAIVLLLGSVAMLIALINRLGLLQIHRMLDFTSEMGRRVIEATYAPLEAPDAAEEVEDYASLTPSQVVKHEGRPEALQAIDVPALIAVASATNSVVVVVCPVGDTLVEGTVMLRVYGASGPIDEARLRDAFETGIDRTFEQDPKYAIRLLVDIAIKALSPAINDPTTAVQALNYVEDLLRRLSRFRLELSAYRDRAGSIRVIVPYPSWDDFLALAFDEIRYCGATSVQVMRRMSALIADLLSDLPPERHEALKLQQRRLEATIARTFTDAMEKEEASVEDRQGLGTPRAE